MSSNYMNGNMKGSNSRSDRFVFMFVQQADGRYILYKVDALEFLNSSQSADVDLLPLIVFDVDILPECECAFSYVNPNFYIIGEKNQDVFTLNKDALLRLNPSEDNTGFGYLKPIDKPMNGNKMSPLAFDYKHKLYVLSRLSHYVLYENYNEFYDFEVYNPADGSWRDLGMKSVRETTVKSYLVLGNMVYFTTIHQSIMSFDLDLEVWGTVFDPYGAHYHPNPFSSKDYSRSYHTFDSQIQVTGNQIFGGLKYVGNGPSTLKPHQVSFLRPALAQSNDFFSSWFSAPRQYNNFVHRWSTYIVTMDTTQRIMCVICYGNDELGDYTNNYDEEDDCSNHAVLTFFQVADDSCQATCAPLVDEGEFPRVKVDPDFSYSKKNNVDCFKATFLHRTILHICTANHYTQGVKCN